MSHSTLKPLALLLITVSAVLSLAVSAHAAGPAIDPVSGLPLLPGLTARNEPMAITICGKPAQANQYLARMDKVATDIAWFKAHLTGYRLYHAFWNDRSQDTFYSPDGTKGVSITGTPQSENVFSVMYLTIKTGLNDHERTVFSPSNPTCK